MDKTTYVEDDSACISTGEIILFDGNRRVCDPWEWVLIKYPYLGSISTIDTGRRQSDICTAEGLYRAILWSLDVSYSGTPGGGEQNPRSIHIRESRGRGRHPPTVPNSFVFAYIFTEKRPHRRSAPPPPPSGKSWIRH